MTDSAVHHIGERYTVKEIGKTLAISITPQRKPRKQNEARSGEKIRSPQSVSRSMRRIREIVECNEPQFIFTISFPPHIGRGDQIEEQIKPVITWLKNQKSRNPDFKYMEYLLILEPYADRRKQAHVHGFLLNFPISALQNFRQAPGRKPYKVLAKLKQGKTVYFCPAFKQKYGYNLIEPVEDKLVWLRYCTKKLSLAPEWLDNGKDVYYASRGWQRPEVLDKGFATYDRWGKLDALSTGQYQHRIPGTDSIAGKTILLKNTPENRHLVKQILPNDLR